MESSMTKSLLAIVICMMGFDFVVPGVLAKQKLNKPPAMVYLATLSSSQLTSS